MFLSIGIQGISSAIESSMPTYDIVDSLIEEFIVLFILYVTDSTAFALRYFEL